MMDHRGRLALCGAALLLACGCTPAEAEDTETLAPDGQPVTAQAVTTRPGPAEEAGDGALLEGVLKLHNGCLVVMPEDGGAPVVPVFPEQAVAEAEDGLVFTDAEGRTLTLAEGEQAVLGGGRSGDADSCLAEAPTFTVWQNG